jgi:CRISP-associated protein Cas1
MIKQSLYFGNPYQLSTRLEQLIIKSKELPDEVIRPIEDIGFVILDHAMITLTHGLVQKFAFHNVAVIWCDDKHLPTSLLLPLDGNHLQSERFRAQVAATEPLKKQLWKQTIEAKISNQADLMAKMQLDDAPLRRYAAHVLSGDTNNREGLASRHYWEHLFNYWVKDFTRDRYGNPPNNLLNYGYAILRAAVARALVGAGLLPTLGIQHHNRYNAYCLADDIMEPFRPFVDQYVVQIIANLGVPDQDLSKDHKAAILKVLTADTFMEGKGSPLMIAIQKSANSLVHCFEGDARKLLFPKLPTT